MQHIASLIQSALDSNGPGNEIGRLPRAIPRPRTRTLTDLFGKEAWSSKGTDAERQAVGASQATVELYRVAAELARGVALARSLPDLSERQLAAIARAERAARITAAAYEAAWLVHLSVPCKESLT